MRTMIDDNRFRMSLFVGDHWVDPMEVPERDAVINDMKIASDYWADRLARDLVLDREAVVEHLAMINRSIAWMQGNAGESA